MQKIYGGFGGQWTRFNQVYCPPPPPPPPPHTHILTVLTFLVQYCDAVLKTLPDIRTVIALRQRLLQSASAGGRKARVGKELDIKDLLPADVLKNKGKYVGVKKLILSGIGSCLTTLEKYLSIEVAERA